MNTQPRKYQGGDIGRMKTLLFSFPVFAVGVFLIFFLEDQNENDFTDLIDDKNFIENNNSIGVSLTDQNWGSNWMYKHSCKGQELYFGYWDFEVLSFCNV